MGRPKALKVGSKTYAIVWTPDDWEEGHYGQTHHPTLRILINTSVAFAQQQDTLFHEIFHCVFAQVGNPANYKGVEEQEEHWATTLTPWFLTIMKHNPDVVDFILADDEKDFSE